jgi:hypothetical protein
MTDKEKLEYYILLKQEEYKCNFGYVIDTEWLRDIIISSKCENWLKL